MDQEANEEEDTFAAASSLVYFSCRACHSGALFGSAGESMACAMASLTYIGVGVCQVAIALPSVQASPVRARKTDLL